MGETFTNNFNAVINDQTQVEEPDIRETLDADEMIFYHSLRADLDLLKRKPKLQTIHGILDYSKSLR